jgi:hypothetical protein
VVGAAQARESLVQGHGEAGRHGAAVLVELVRREVDAVGGAQAPQVVHGPGSGRVSIAIDCPREGSVR